MDFFRDDREAKAREILGDLHGIDRIQIVKTQEKALEDWEKAEIALAEAWEEKRPRAQGTGSDRAGDRKPDATLLSVDDRTGIVYAVQDPLGSGAGAGHVHGSLVKRAELGTAAGELEGAHGHGHGRPFKAEWALVKDGRLFVGSHGNLQKKRSLFVKVVEGDWRVRTEDWTERYTKLAQAAGVPAGGYCVFEAAEWLEEQRKWIFLPRRVVREGATAEALLPFTGSNLLLEADEDFAAVPLANEPSRTFSTVKAVPGFPGELLALKTFDTECSTYVATFGADGRLLLPETFVCAAKFEGAPRARAPRRRARPSLEPREIAEIKSRLAVTKSEAVATRDVELPAKLEAAAAASRRSIDDATRVIMIEFEFAAKNIRATAGVRSHDFDFDFVDPALKAMARDNKLDPEA
eukprot:tig00000367_g24473.t1